MKDIYECNVLTLVNDIMMKNVLDPLSRTLKKKHNEYDVRRKNQLVVPAVRLCLGDKAVRVTGASLWNNMHKDMVQYRCKECFKGKLKKYYISFFNLQLF